MKIIGNKNRRYNKDTKNFNRITNETIKCKCGHSMLIGARGKRICSHCGKMVFKNPKDEFEYRLRGML